MWFSGKTWIISVFYLSDIDKCVHEVPLQCRSRWTSSVKRGHKVFWKILVKICVWTASLYAPKESFSRKQWILSHFIFVNFRCGVKLKIAYREPRLKKRVLLMYSSFLPRDLKLISGQTAVKSLWPVYKWVFRNLWNLVM